jgi:predicted metal-dependent peptidase
MNNTDNMAEVRIKRAHITMMKHPATAIYSGIMVMGESSVTDGAYTAYTDGLNKRYSKNFIKDLSEPQLRGLVLHENLHVALKHLQFGLSMFKENAKLANIAADMVVNNIIKDIKARIKDESELLVDLPEGGVYDEFFRGWSMREVYNHLKKENPDKEGGGGSGDSVKVNGKNVDADGHDEHDFENLAGKSAEDIKKEMEKVERALREGGLLAGRMGADIPREIGDSLAPKINWRDVMREFITSATKGKDDYTWRRMNRRHMMNDIYLPTSENETVGEIVFAVDTSGSISNDDLAKVAGELASLCELCEPERVRVLWWDTKVHGEQLFSEDYAGITKMLKPKGGGGTIASCVAEYLTKSKVKAECVVMFTDGYLENNIKWSIDIPTLWLVTHNRSFQPPKGTMVRVED